MEKGEEKEEDGGDGLIEIRKHMQIYAINYPRQNSSFVISDFC